MRIRCIHVMLGTNGEILGQAMPPLPIVQVRRTTGTAQLAITTQSDAYVATRGCIDCLIGSGPAGSLLDLQWTDDGITYVGERLRSSLCCIFSIDITTCMQPTPASQIIYFCGAAVCYYQRITPMKSKILICPDNLVSVLWHITTGCRNGGDVSFISMMANSPSLADLLPANKTLMQNWPDLSPGQARLSQ